LSENLIDWLDSFIEGLLVPANDRAIIAAACQDVALVHHKAIVLSTRNLFHASAFGLVRLQFEAYVRGAWLRHCASDEQVARFKERDKLDRNFGQLIADLECQEAFNVGVLSRIKAQSWKEMNSFTHTGLLQVVRRITSTRVEAMYPEEEVLGTLDFADSIALWSALAIVDVVLGEPEEKEQLATQLLERMEQFAKQ
jgi:hypothetical protein